MRKPAAFPTLALSTTAHMLISDFKETCSLIGAVSEPEAVNAIYGRINKRQEELVAYISRLERSLSISQPITLRF